MRDLMKEGVSLEAETGELVVLLAAWLAERVREGHRPVPLWMALKEMSAIAAGGSPAMDRLYAAALSQREALNG